LGTDLELSGLDPDMLGVQTWLRLRSLDAVVNVQTFQKFLPSDPREYGRLIRANSVSHGRVRHRRVGERRVDMATTINQAGLILNPLNNECVAKLGQLTQLEDRVPTAGDRSRSGHLDNMDSAFRS
jgi:hypothetical protein